MQIKKIYLAYTCFIFIFGFQSNADVVSFEKKQSEKIFKNLICPSNDALSIEFVKLQLLGQRYYNINNSCLNELNSKYILSVHDESKVHSTTKIKFINSSKSSSELIHIIKISEVSTGTFKVDFEWKYESERLKDEFVFSAYKGNLKESFGCIGVLKYPKYNVVYEKCKKP